MQNHLTKIQTINLGSFYTPKNIVEIVYKLLQKRVNLKDFLLFDSSCGYGDFFIHHNLGSFFKEDGAYKYWTIKQGLKWNGGEVFDDYC